MRMKTVYRLVIAILPAFLAAGCENDTNTGMPADGWVPVEIAGAEITAEVQTRGASVIIIGNMGMFRTAANGYMPVYNVLYTYNNGWKSSATVYVGGRDAMLCAYYPYNAATFTASSTICTLSAGRYDSGKDLCYAVTGGETVCNKTPGANFAMTRGYARIKLSITRKASYMDNCNITNVNLKNGTDFFAVRTLDISNGTYAGSAAGGGWTYALNTGNIAAGATNTSYDVLVPPQQVNSGLTITLTTDGVNRTVTVPATSFSNNLGAGRQYTISLSISEVDVILNGNIAITDMVTDGTDIKNDNPTELS